VPFTYSLISPDSSYGGIDYGGMHYGDHNYYGKKYLTSEQIFPILAALFLLTGGSGGYLLGNSGLINNFFGKI